MMQQQNILQHESFDNVIEEMLPSTSYQIPPRIVLRMSLMFN